MRQSIDSNTCVMQAEGHLSADLGDGETALLGADLEHYFGLNRVGARVWELAATPISIEAICASLGEEFEVDRETCEKQVTALVRDLVANSLFRVVGRAGR